MISFEFKKSTTPMDRNEVEIVLDRTGLEALCAQLQLLSDGKSEHAHLMSESWGGSHLSESPVNPENLPIRHVKIILV